MYFTVKTKFNKRAADSTVSLIMSDDDKKISTSYQLTFFEANRLFRAIQGATLRLIDAEEATMTPQKGDPSL